VVRELTRAEDCVGPAVTRVASLLPSATEIICALGARDTLVGVSHECDFPAGVAALPALTRARLKPVTRSRDIDTEVRAVLQDALAVYEIELDRLAAARPDVIVTQDLCDVCAVSLDDVRAAVARLARREDIRIVNLHPMRLGDLWADIARVAAALARPDTGARVVKDLRARVAEIEARSAACHGRPRVLSIEWIDPVMIGGMWMPELIALAGGRPLLTRAGDHAPTLTREALAALSPDVVLVKPCGFPLERTLAELETLRTALPWGEWDAVRAGHVYVGDGNAYFNRPGPRLVESLEILAACVHPEAFADFRGTHRGAVVRVEADLRCEPW
jgi:iron complex transport system substrate-binding protein